jgi:SAM-dependent methyltransferase
MTSSPSCDDPEPGALVSARWAEWRRSLSIDDYERRFAQMEAAGTAAHGEADLIASYTPRTVLDAGCGTGRVAIELDRRGIEVAGVDLDGDMIEAARRKAPWLDWTCADLATLELGRRFDVVAMPGNVPLFCRPEDRGSVIGRSVAHVGDGGRFVIGFSLERGPGVFTLDELDRHVGAAGAELGSALELESRFATWEGAPYRGGNYAVSVYASTPAT